MQKEKKNTRGITLVALVITIIVLLILSGVTISALSGNNGILTRATAAQETTKKQSLLEEIRLNIVEKQVDNEIGEVTSTSLKEVLEQYFDGVPDADEIKPETTLNTKSKYGNYSFKVSDIYNGNVNGTLKYTPYRDADNVKVPVPEGFTVSTKTGENTVKNGLVIKDSSGNEYVWIPCTTDATSSDLKFERTRWGVEDDNSTEAFKDELTLNDANVTYSDNDIQNGITANIGKEIVEQIKKEKASVEKYGGYYIGRYEVGKSGETPVIKANQEPYASIIWSKAYNLAKSIGGGTGATTYLCSSYAWDTAINFIQNNGTTGYAEQVTGFNGNWSSQEVKDSSGNTIKPAGTAQRLNTGLTTAQSNIYDMGGNVGEFTTEINPGTGESVVLRGGSYSINGPAGYRWDRIASDADSDYGFRATLFLK